MRASLTTACAERPTAMQAQAENRNTSAAPSRPPTNTSGCAMSTCASSSALGTLQDCSREQQACREVVAKCPAGIGESGITAILSAARL